jgi:hypothetical protein
VKTKLKRVSIVLGMVLAVSFLVANASAECGLGKFKMGASLRPQSWRGSSVFGPASLLLVSSDDEDSIVGFWRVNFTAKGNPDIPDGAPIDSAYIQWHADRTELMNSGRPPQDGNFCMGVWEKVGRSKYVLNHFAIGNDTNGNPQGPTQIQETVWLSPDGNSYAGTFVLNAYDLSHNNTARILGVITATRITVKTPVTAVF